MADPIRALHKAAIVIGRQHDQGEALSAVGALPHNRYAAKVHRFSDNGLTRGPIGELVAGPWAPDHLVASGDTLPGGRSDT